MINRLDKISHFSLIAAMLLLFCPDAWAEGFSVLEYWGKTEPEIAKAFPEAKSEYQCLVVENTKNWQEVSFLFEKGKLWSICFSAKESLTEKEARERAINELGLKLPREHEVRTPGLVAFRDMKGRIKIVNLIYKTTGSYEQINKIWIFFSYN
ncbi:MAG: hypothetical protein Q8M07_00180 [Prosthecobacter sp.]|nr:hypothetical protein [Prosthecobacter sp.]